MEKGLHQDATSTMIREWLTKNKRCSWYENGKNGDLTMEYAIQINTSKN